MTAAETVLQEADLLKRVYARALTTDLDHV